MSRSDIVLMTTASQNDSSTLTSVQTREVLAALYEATLENLPTIRIRAEAAGVTLGEYAAAILRRGLAFEPLVEGSLSDVRVGRLTIDTDSGGCYWDGITVKLTRKEFQALQLLANRAGRLVRTEQLIARLWPNEAESVCRQRAKSCITRIRVKLPGLTIESSRHVGYTLIVPGADA
jgi:hypothetical protein